MANLKLATITNIDEKLEGIAEKKLDIYRIKQLLRQKLISKSTYIQLAFAHDFGAGTIPNCDNWKDFLERWNVDDKINFADVLGGLAKLYRNFYKNDKADTPILQLNLFELLVDTTF